MGFLKTIGIILALPFILVFLLLALAIWLFTTVTCIGPLLNLLCSYLDEPNLVPSSDVRKVRTPQGYELAIRYSGWADGAHATEHSDLLSNTHSSQRRHYPILIPNGLSATLVATSRIHERLVAAGFEVVSFDRLGVGFSDENPYDRPATVDECVRDAMFCAEHVLPKQEKWHLLGPSMGAIVSQCMIAQHPDRFVGFLNMDGFPAAFENKREKFLQSSIMWRLMGMVAWTGIVRLGMSLAPLDMFASDTYPATTVKAQMKQSRLYRNTYLEFPLMLDLAASATTAWGPLSMSALPEHSVSALVRVEPAQNGIYEHGQWQTLPRAVCERGDTWLSDDATQALIRELKAMQSSTPLARAWATLAVRVMNGRNYDYPGGDSFYDPEMKDKAAAEGTMHVIMAGDGARYAFPTVGHDTIFTHADAITQCMIEIDDAAARLQGISSA